MTRKFKIEKIGKINHNLLSIAQAIYKSWFVDFEPWGGFCPKEWKNGMLGDIVVIHDSKRIPLSGKQREKMRKIYPYYGAASLMDYVDSYIFDGTYLLLGEDGTVIDEKGFPVLQYVWGQFWVNNHAHILTGKNGFTVENMYLLLSRLPIKGIVTGAVQPKISQSNLKSLPVTIPKEDVLNDFNARITPLFKLYKESQSENQRLTALRDSLLPRLMSGELDVSTLEI